MGGFKVGAPNPTTGFVKDDHGDHLLAFVEPRAEEASTSFGESTAARCSFVVCLDDRSVTADVLLFGSVIVPRVTGTESEIVVGRLGKGLAKPGRSAPWLLDDPTDDDLTKVEAFLARYAVRTPSGKTIVEEPADGDEPF
jgi:hypothetical protein